MKEEPVRSQNWSKGEFKVPSIYFQRGISSQQIRKTDRFSCSSSASSGDAESTVPGAGGAVRRRCEGAAWRAPLYKGQALHVAVSVT